MDIERYNLNEYLLGFTLLTLPVSIKLNSIALVVFFVYNLYLNVKNKTFPKIRDYYFHLIILSIQLFGYFSSSDLIEANKKLLLFFSFFAFIFLFLPSDKSLRIERILVYLPLGVFLMIVYGGVRVLYDILELNVRYDYGRGVNLWLEYVPHHTYFSLYAISSILILTYMVGKKMLKATYLITLPVLYIVVFMLPSRIAILFAISVVPFFVFRFLANAYAKKKLAVFFGIAFLAVLTIGFSFDYARDKLVYAVYEIAGVPTERKPFYGVSKRKKVWGISIEVIKEHAFLGCGIGDSQQVLNQKFLENGYEELIGINAHSQYLQGAIYYGIPLAIVFFGIMTWSAIELFLAKKFLLFSIWMLVLTIFFTESILNRQWGVVFVALLLTLSSYGKTSEKNVKAK